MASDDRTKSYAEAAKCVSEEALERLTSNTPNKRMAQFLAKLPDCKSQYDGDAIHGIRGGILCELDRSLFTRSGVLNWFMIIHIRGDIVADIKNEIQKLMTQSETLPEDRDNLHPKISERASTERRKKRKGKQETNEINIA